MKISELIDGIKKRDIVLPEFQRQYVWLREQAKQLMVSLSKEYPVGSILFWKTDKPPDLKNLHELPEKFLGAHKSDGGHAGGKHHQHCHLIIKEFYYSQYEKKNH